MADPFSIETWRKLFTRHGQKVVYGLTGVFGISLVVSFGMGRYGTGNGDQGAGGQNPQIATVNGQPITLADYQAMQQQTQRSGSLRGQPYDQVQERVLSSLVAETVAQQEAKKANVRASDADIDREMQQERDTVLPKGASDSDWEDYVQQNHHMSLEEYRDAIGKELLAPALLHSYADAEKVSDEDARNQFAEVNLFPVMISTTASPLAKNQKPLSDAEAKKKAEDLLAKAKSGADLKTLVKTNSAQGSDMGWRPEYQTNPQMPELGALLGGKDFDEAVHKTPKGQFTDVVKTTGIMPGYTFAKVIDRRINTPKDFDPKKIAEALKQQRAETKFREMIQAKVKAANVVFTDPDKKTYYDLANLAQMQGPMGGSAASSQADIDKQQAMVDAEIEAMQKRNPTDATAALLEAGVLKRKQYKGTTPQQKDQIRDQLITMYENALKSTENRDIRFQLADLYRDKKQTANAEGQYDEISKLLAADPPYDPTTMQTAVQAEQKLVAGYNSIGKPDKAKAEQTKMNKIMAQMVEAQKQQAEAQKQQQAEALKQQQAAQKAAAPGGTLNLAPGGSGTINVTAPASGGAANSPAPTTGSAGKPTGSAPASKSAAPGAAVPAPTGSAPAPNAAKPAGATK